MREENDREAGIRPMLNRMRSREGKAVPQNGHDQNGHELPEQPAKELTVSKPSQPVIPPRAPSPSVNPDLMGALKALLDQASRGEQRQARIEQLNSAASQVKAERDALNERLAEIEAEQLSLMAEEEADGGEDARAILDGLQRLAAKAKPR
jgi:hypothetical protein